MPEKLINLFLRLADPFSFTFTPIDCDTDSTVELLVDMTRELNHSLIGHTVWLKPLEDINSSLSLLRVTYQFRELSLCASNHGNFCICCYRS